MNSTVVTLQSPHLRTLFASERSSENTVKNELISNLAKSCLSEFAMSLVYTGVTSLFITTSAGIASLIVTSLAVTAINTTIKSVTAYLQHRRFQLRNDHTPEALTDREIMQGIAGVFNWCSPTIFAYLDSITRDVLTHEGGHALAASLLYEGHFEIEIFPDGGGVTRFFPFWLKNLGEYFGKKNSALIVSAAGSAASVFFATGSLVLASHIRKTHPQLHRYLVASAIMSIARHTFYAISALWTSPLHFSHDFIFLWRYGGIHPIVSAIAIIALPILSLAAFGKASQPAPSTTN